MVIDAKYEGRSISSRPTIIIIIICTLFITQCTMKYMKYRVIGMKSLKTYVSREKKNKKRKEKKTLSKNEAYNKGKEKQCLTNFYTLLLLL